MKNKALRNASFLLVVVGNLWIWRILSYNIFLGFFLIVVTYLLYLILKKVKLSPSLFFVLFVIVLVFQWKTTSVQNLSLLDNDEQRVQQMRLREYPPVFIRLGNKTLWIPAAWWFEGRPESIISFRVLDNLFETLDPSLYFFANHPRERVGIEEFEKFPYIYLPFFLYGLTFLVKEKKSFWLIAFFLPLTILSFIGHKSQLGPFSLFPFFAVLTSEGIFQSLLSVKKKYKKKSNKLFVVGILIFVLIFIQLLSYEIY